MTNSLPFTKKPLFVPPLEEIVEVIRIGLATNFAYVETKIVYCPDLSEKPFSLASSGLCGNPNLVDLGGPPYLLPLVRREKIYDVKDIHEIVGLKSSLIIGAGAGPWPYIGVNCEGIYNLTVEDGRVKNRTRISKVDQSTGKSVQQILPDSETKCSLLANLLVSEGKPGQVLEVHCKIRTGSENFISCIRNTLANAYKDNIVGLGGVFILKEGKAKQHVMPDFSTIPIHTDDEVNKWLKFYEMSAPLVALGTLISGDYGMDLRVQHFHSFSHHGEAGHYHYDTTPDTVEYLGYFTVAENIYRVDQPTNTHQMGRD